MIALGLATAWAAPPPLAALPGAEAEANQLIASCQRGACAATPEALGEAFFTRAAAAAVLRGQLDDQAAANGALLLPGAVSAWQDLLPDVTTAQPEPWVRHWIGLEPAPPLLSDALEPSTPPRLDPALIHARSSLERRLSLGRGLSRAGAEIMLGSSVIGGVGLAVALRGVQRSDEDLELAGLSTAVVGGGALLVGTSLATVGSGLAAGALAEAGVDTAPPTLAWIGCVALGLGAFVGPELVGFGAVLGTAGLFAHAVDVDRTVRRYQARLAPLSLDGGGGLVLNTTL